GCGTPRGSVVGARPTTGVEARGTRRWHRTGGRGPRSHRTGETVPPRSGADRRAGRDPFGPEQFRRGRPGTPDGPRTRTRPGSHVGLGGAGGRSPARL